MIWLFMLLNLVFVGLDAVRDAWLKERKPGVSRQNWHLVKQTSFYGFEALITSALYLAGLIPISWVSVWIGAGYVLISWLLWKALYLGEKYED